MATGAQTDGDCVVCVCVCVCVGGGCCHILLDKHTTHDTLSTHSSLALYILDAFFFLQTESNRGNRWADMSVRLVWVWT